MKRNVKHKHKEIKIKEVTVLSEKKAQKMLLVMGAKGLEKWSKEKEKVDNRVYEVLTSDGEVMKLEEWARRQGK